MKTIKQTVHINAKPEEVYEAYVDAQKHAEFTGGKTKFDAVIGGKFDIWEGSLTGENLELVSGKKIVQKWRSNDWPEGHYSDLTLEFEPESDSGQARMTRKEGTKLILIQKNVPDDKADDIDDGWHEYYWKPMNDYFKSKSK